MPCPLYTGPWGLMRGSTPPPPPPIRPQSPVYNMSTIYRAEGSDEGVCICYVHYLQGCGA